MDNINISGSSSGEGGYPGRTSNNSSGGIRSFNPLLLERGAAAPLPPPTFANTNGMLSRPSGGIPPSTSESNRTHQQQSDVFMVREASRPNMSSSSSSVSAAAADRAPFTGASADPLNLTGERQFSSEHHITSSTSNNLSSTNRHHRSSSERTGVKESKKELLLPRMLKVAVVGESTSGKTGICNAFTSEGYSFSRNYHMTSGVTIYAKSIRLPSGGGVDGSGDAGFGGGISSALSEDQLLEPRINLVLVDSAGKPLYRELLPQYWDQLDGLALVIDLTSSTALESASDWFNLAKECLKVGRFSRHQPSLLSDETGDQSGGGGGNKRGSFDSQNQSSSSTILGVLIGSKNDLKDQRVISPKAAQDFAAQHGLQYFECSVKENSGIEEPFYYLAHQWAVNNPSSIDKENSEKESGGNATSSSGGIFAKSSSSGNPGAPSSSSRKSAFATRQNSSEGF